MENTIHYITQNQIQDCSIMMNTEIIEKDLVIGSQGQKVEQGIPGIEGPPESRQLNPIIPTKTMMNVYSVTQQTILQGEAVVFDTSCAMMGCCHHVTNSPDVWIWSPGYYMVYTCIYHIDVFQMALIKNNTERIPQSVIGSLIGESQSMVMFLLEIKDIDMIIETPYSDTGMACKLQLVNYKQENPRSEEILLISHEHVGFEYPQITASMVIISV
jgi:hypothetical protein